MGFFDFLKTKSSKQEKRVDIDPEEAKKRVPVYAIAEVYFMVNPKFKQAIFRLWNSMSEEVKTAIKELFQDYDESYNFDGKRGEYLLVREFVGHFTELQTLRENIMSSRGHRHAKELFNKYDEDFTWLQQSLLDIEDDFSEDIRDYFGIR